MSPGKGRMLTESRLAVAGDAVVRADGGPVTASRDVKPSAGCEEAGKGFEQGNGLVRHMFVDSLYAFKCVGNLERTQGECEPEGSLPQCCARRCCPRYWLFRKGSWLRLAGEDGQAGASV